MKNLRVKILALCAVFVAGVLSLVYFTREPSTDGRTLSQWLRLGSEFHHPSRDNTDVTNAIRKIGVKGIPILLDKLTATDAAWKRMFANKWGDRFHAYRWTHPALNQHYEAVYGFSILGTQAGIAIPELTRMLSLTNNSFSASALARIGPEGWAVLKSGLTNPIPFVRANALMGLNDSRIDLQDVWPEVLARRHDTNVQVSWCAIYVILGRPERPESISVVAEGLKHPSPQIQMLTLAKLRDWGTNAAAPVAPLIISFLTNANYSVQRYAKFALLKADPAAARAQGIPENGPP